MSAAVARVAARVSLTMRSQNERADFRAIADGDALMRGNMRDLWVLANRNAILSTAPVNEDSRGRLTLRTLYSP